MKFQIKNIAVALITIVTIFSCEKDDPVAVSSTTGEGSVILEFDNIVSTGASQPDDLVLGSYSFMTSEGETITVSDINYIISNIILVKDDGTEVPYSKDALYIMNEKQGVDKIELKNIPAGNYKTVKFGLGVEEDYWAKGETAQQAFWDEAKLDYNRMTWSWTSGYKFVLFEGMYTAKGGDTAEPFKVHLGGYSPNNNYQQISVDLATNAVVISNQSATVHLYADIKQIIEGHHALKFEDGAAIMNGDRAKMVAHNVSHLFTVDHVHNSHN